MDKSHYVYLIANWWTFSWFQLMGWKLMFPVWFYERCFRVHLHSSLSVDICFHSSWVLYLRVELLGHMANLCLSFKKLWHIFPKQLPTNSNTWGFWFLHILVNICCCLFLIVAIVMGVRLLHCSFNLHFPNDINTKHLLITY